MKWFRRLLSLKVWLPILALGLVLMVMIPAMAPRQAARYAPHPAPAPSEGEMQKRSGPTPPESTPVPKAQAPAPSYSAPINWTSVLSQVCIALGSIAAIVRGIVEFIKLIIPKRAAIAK
jgi:hypothetical protein